jgi:GNAT superfamily N-acetyltransferase
MFDETAAALGYRSDRVLHEAGVVFERHDGYTVTRMPDNPTYFWGNRLVFDRAPQMDDARRWPQLFAQHIGVPQPASRHWAFGWREAQPGAVQPFLDQGCTLLESVVMTARRLDPYTPKVSVVLRPLADADWAALHALHMLDRPVEHPPEAYAEFKHREIAQWSRLCAVGRGRGYGAFHGDALCAALGIFVDIDASDGLRLARYQQVLTHPQWRRRGLCRALLQAAARYATDTKGAELLVIVADALDTPREIYAAAGFTDRGVMYGLQRCGY